MIWNMKLPNKLSRGARKDFRHAPKIGEQSIEVLGEAGLSDAEIDALLASGAVDQLVAALGDGAVAVAAGAVAGAGSRTLGIRCAGCARRSGRRHGLPPS